MCYYTTGWPLSKNYYHALFIKRNIDFPVAQRIAENVLFAYTWYYWYLDNKFYKITEHEK